AAAGRAMVSITVASRYARSESTVSRGAGGGVVSAGSSPSGGTETSAAPACRALSPQATRAPAVIAMRSQERDTELEMREYQMRDARCENYGCGRRAAG